MMTRTKTGRCALLAGALWVSAALTAVEGASSAGTRKPTLPLDLLVERALKGSGKSFAPYADRTTLFRRLHFDLTGLAPSSSETAAFLADKDPRAWSKAVDRLLASPTFGERWGALWLDGAGYADVYRQSDKERPLSEAWRYRDWVVRSFNQDIPYPQFVARQIAGDVEPDLAARWDPANFVATGFLTVGLRAGVSDRNDSAARQQARLIGETLLGLKSDNAGRLIGVTGEDEAGLLGIFRAVRSFEPPNGSLMRLSLLNEMQAKARDERIARESNLTERVRSIGETLRREYATRMQAETARYLTALWDYRRRPEADAGLSPLAFAAKQGLNPFAFQRWQELSLAQTYAPLAKAAAGVGGNAKVFSWQGDGNVPSAVINTTDEALQIATFRLLPRSVSVHPSPSGGVGVVWRSPTSGVLKVSGFVQDADSACGNGIAWRLSRQTAAGETILVKGDLENGGGAKFGQEGLRIDTYPGESLLLAIEPKSEYSCDTTTIDLTLASEDGKSVWNLARDLVADPIFGNPHPDSQGRPGVWSYVDLLRKADRPAPAGLPTEALTAWRTAMSAADAGRGNIEKAAQAFQAQFKLNGPESPFWIGTAEEERYLPEAERIAYQRMAAELADLRRNPLPEIEYTHGVREILNAGDSSFRRVPRSLGGPMPKPVTSGSGRVELAQWLASTENPRPARAWVNRVWGRLLAAPLSDTPGSKGSGPAEEVLAKLSESFQSDMGGSTKAMIRLLVHSRAYHQVSTPIASAPRWTQQAPRRLTSVEVRDIALQSIGRLAARSPRGVDSQPDSSLRSLYLAHYRNEGDGTTIATIDEQRLDAAAAAVATKVLASSRPDGRSRINQAYQLLLGRAPTPSESNDALRRLGEAALKSGGKSEVAWTEYAGYLLRSAGVRNVR